MLHRSQRGKSSRKIPTHEHREEVLSSVDDGQLKGCLEVPRGCLRLDHEGQSGLCGVDSNVQIGFNLQLTFDLVSSFRLETSSDLEKVWIEKDLSTDEIEDQKSKLSSTKLQTRKRKN